MPVCPEQLAGLPTPRPEIEFRGGDGESLIEGGARALSKDGTDYTEALLRGAGEVLRIARLYGIKNAVLKDGSPSCGVAYVYVGGRKAKGAGVTAALLKSAGIEVRTVDSI